MRVKRGGRDGHVPRRSRSRRNPNTGAASQAALYGAIPPRNPDRRGADHRARIGAIVYICSLAGLFGVSALYHLGTWDADVAGQVAVTRS